MLTLLVNSMRIGSGSCALFAGHHTVAFVCKPSMLTQKYIVACTLPTPHTLSFENQTMYIKLGCSANHPPQSDTEATVQDGELTHGLFWGAVCVILNGTSNRKYNLIFSLYYIIYIYIMYIIYILHRLYSTTNLCNDSYFTILFGDAHV